MKECAAHQPYRFGQRAAGARALFQDACYNALHGPDALKGNSAFITQL